MAAAGKSDQIRIVVLGKTGVGKSATGNTILGKKDFDSRMSMCSVTKSCRSGFNREVRIIDTPGFFDTKMSKDDVQREIAKCIAMSAPGPHAFILVVIPHRFTEQELETVKLVKEMFGQDVMRYMVVLFVRKDELDANSTNIDDMLNEAPTTLKDILLDCENRYIVFNNNASESEKKKQSKALIDFVKRLVVRNGGYYSDKMFQTFEAAMNEEQLRREKKIDKDNNKKTEELTKAFLEQMKIADDEHKKKMAIIETAYHKDIEHNNREVERITKEAQRYKEHQKEIARLEKAAYDKDIEHKNREVERIRTEIFLMQQSKEHQKEITMLQKAAYDKDIEHTAREVERIRIEAQRYKECELQKEIARLQKAAYDKDIENKNRERIRNEEQRSKEYERQRQRAEEEAQRSKEYERQKQRSEEEYREWQKRKEDDCKEKRFRLYEEAQKEKSNTRDYMAEEVGSGLLGFLWKKVVGFFKA